MKLFLIFVVLIIHQCSVNQIKPFQAVNLPSLVSYKPQFERAFNFMETEIWKQVIGYESLYEVSNLGRLKSVKRKVSYNRWNKNGTKIIKEKILNPTIRKSNGSLAYYHTRLSFDGQNRDIDIHRLAAIAFLPNPNNLPEVNHKDGNKLNNSVSNLEWTTRKGNAVHAGQNDLMANCERHGMCKYNKLFIETIYAVYKSGFKNQRQLAIMSGISTTHLNRIVNNKTKWI